MFDILYLFLYNLKIRENRFTTEQENAMKAPTIDQPLKGTESTSSASGDSSQPPTSGSKDFEVGKTGYSRWKVITSIIFLIAFAGIAIVGVVQYKDEQASQQMRARDTNEALTDLNNRVDTENVAGRFTRAFYVGTQMRAEWVRNDQLKRCVFEIVPPTDTVKRWTAQDLQADKSFLENIEDRDAIGGYEATACGGIGGG